MSPRALERRLHMPFPSPVPRPRLAHCFLLATVALSSCRPKAEPAPEREAPRPVEAPSSSAAALVAPSASVGPTSRAPGEPPTLVPEPFAGAGGASFSPTRDVLFVHTQKRVGRIAGERVEWLDKEIPPGGGPFGEHLITSVSGRWPDAVDVIFQNQQGRAADPTYFPLTGKGASRSAGLGGVRAEINGVATIGETTLVAVTTGDEEGTKIVVVRGPPLFRKPTPADKGGCTGELFEGPGHKNDAAVVPRAFAATAAGTLVSVGNLCDGRGATAEVWDKGDKGSHPRLVDLSRWVKNLSYRSQLLVGSGDEMWLVNDNGGAIVRYRDGEFSPLPPLGAPVKRAFVSAEGQLHATDGKTLYRSEEGGWRPVARFSWPLSPRQMALVDQTLWAGLDFDIVRFREGQPVTYHEGCPTPFVYLYDTKWDNPDNYTYPSTQKALAGLEGGADLALVDFRELGTRRLGLPVASREQGEAVIAHLKTTMKDEKPELLCFEPKGGRAIAIKGKAK